MQHRIRTFWAWASLAGAAALGACIDRAQAQTSLFTYQGRLLDGGVPANGVYTIEVSLWNAASGGTLVAGPLASGVSVTDGLFTLPINFGTDAFNTDADRWLEIAINNVTLSSRQQVARAPFAMRTRGIFVEEDGDVGIGTTAPASQLHVINNAPGGVAVWGSDIGGGNGRGVFGATNDGYGVFGYASTGVGVFGVNVDPAGWAGYFQGRVFFDDFVGIGASTPIGAGRLVVGTPAFQSGDYGGMYVRTAGVNAWPFYGYSAGGNADMWHYYEGSTGAWHLVNGDPFNPRLTVQSNGEVGIGTTNPAFLLHVDGLAGKPGGGSWTNSSDIRLKKNIADLDDALDQLMKLRGVSFEYIDPESINELPGQRIGMIAQDVEQVFPDWVDMKEDGYKTLTYRGFEALTVEALRELRREKDAQIQLLSDQNAELRARVDALQATLQALLNSQTGGVR
ncbi:MAG: tail fiber domain-containing protein [Phycisphaerales bacterium]|nr:tail fiber domain-containing protein [Phycisphaerales bacterium]